jgi:hypothetical protein
MINFFKIKYRQATISQSFKEFRKQKDKRQVTRSRCIRIIKTHLKLTDKQLLD